MSERLSTYFLQNTHTNSGAHYDVLGDHPDALSFIFLQSVIRTWRTDILVRFEQILELRVAVGSGEIETIFMVFWHIIPTRYTIHRVYFYPTTALHVSGVTITHR